MLIKTRTTSNLREVPCEPDQLAGAIEREKATIDHLRARVASGGEELDEANLGRSLQRVGEYLRLAGCLEDALVSKDGAIEIWDRLGRKRAAFLVRLQRAVTLHYANRHDEALDAFQTLEDEFDEITKVYEDALYEARGRCLWEVGRSEEARAELKRALTVREGRGNAVHIQKTQDLLDAMGC